MSRSRISGQGILGAILLTVSSSPAFAEPVPATALELNGSVAVELCSASIVDLEGSETAPAYFLSAGHCPRYPKFVDPGKALSIAKNEWPNSYGFPLDATVDEPVRIEVARLVYATMTNVDLALYQSKSTVGQMRRAGYRVFRLSNRMPAPGARLRVTSAYWKQTQSCVVDRILRTNADETEIDPSPLNGYEFRDSLFFDRNCRIRSGWSGSPVYDEREGKIYGVVSRMIRDFSVPRLSLATGTVDLMKFMGFQTMNSEFGTLVASNVTGLTACLDPEGKLDFGAKECALPALPTAERTSSWPRLKKKIRR